MAAALGEIGRIRRTLFIDDWLLDIDIQQDADLGLNRDEAHHAVKSTLQIGRQGDTSEIGRSEAQHERIAGSGLFRHISPLG